MTNVTWTHLLDDAAIFPPGNADLPSAVKAWSARTQEWYADLVGSFVITDTRLGEIKHKNLPLSIVITGGAGAISPALTLASKHGMDVRAVEIALRDLDDLPGNAHRVTTAVDAARADSLLADATQVFVELPQTSTEHGWLAAADEVAGAELRLKFRTGGTSPEAFPTAATLAGWIDAALDRETSFKCTAGLHDGLRHRDPETGFEHHGFLNVLLATDALFEGGSAGDAAQLLDAPDPTLDADALARGRRWFTSFGSCSILEPLDSLLTLGLLEAPQ